MVVQIALEPCLIRMSDRDWKTSTATINYSALFTVSTSTDNRELTELVSQLLKGDSKHSVASYNEIYL